MPAETCANCGRYLCDCNDHMDDWDNPRPRAGRSIWAAYTQCKACARGTQFTPPECKRCGGTEFERLETFATDVRRMPSE